VSTGHVADVRCIRTDRAYERRRDTGGMNHMARFLGGAWRLEWLRQRRPSCTC
jgi:hypothetical protein